MIVTVNNNNSDKYLSLFTEAYEYLKELDKGYVDINQERFSSLAEYYSHMADFFENQKYKYVMLPLDEEPFNIDLNTRSINVPTSFIKCASVQSDQLAETIVFVTDRYFDYMDLANTEIYVQWTIPENKKTGVAEYNGATRVEMIDLETEPGKIRFAWPLNDKITEVPGTVKFSVRFFRIDNADTNKLLYSLNTLEASIIIREALQPSLNTDATVESPVSDDSFRKAILNSLFSNEGVIPPVQPVYFAPGSNIMADTMMDVEGIKVVSLENDTITLKVQAIVADAGEITYKWFHKDEDGSYYDCENYPVFNANGEPTGETTTFGTVQDVYVLIEKKPEARVTNERYYAVDATNPNGYSLYTGDFPANVDLYERYSTFQVPGEGTITGHYQAAAWNNIAVPNGYSRYQGEVTEEIFNNNIFYIKDASGYAIATEFDANAIYYVNKVLTTLYPTYSEECLLPAPSEVIYAVGGNLAEGAILKAINEEEGIFGVDLKIATETDKYQPIVKYNWYKSVVSSDDVLNLVAADLTNDNEDNVFMTTDVPVLNVSEAAWYCVNVVSELNRTIKTKRSIACKVTNKPEPPYVDPQVLPFGNVTKNPVSFTVVSHILNPDDKAALLLSDNISYIWQVSHADTNETYIDITDNFAGVEGLGTDTLTVSNKLKQGAANFRCLVINELNGAKAVFDHSGVYDDKNNTLGEFKPEAPFVYEDTVNNYVFTVVNMI